MNKQSKADSKKHHTRDTTASSYNIINGALGKIRLPRFYPQD